MSKKNQAIKGLTGEVYNARIISEAAKQLKTVADVVKPQDLDLVKMAKWALHYLTYSPRKEFNYEPVFQCAPLRYPPIPEGHDVVVPCDTDARMDWEWYYMRDIAGSDAGNDVEVMFHERMKGYLDEKGRAVTHPGCYNEGRIDAVYGEEDYKIHIWGTCKILKSLSEDYRRKGDTSSLDLARKVMKGLKDIALWDDKGRCWFACGMGMLGFDGVPVPNGWNSHPAPVIVPLLTYYEVSGDDEALDFAKAYAKGIIESAQPGGIRFNADGSFDGHSHATMHAVWGIAELGVLTDNERYVDFAKKVWDFMLRRGTGTGWFPAKPDSCNETCCVSDMMSVAAALGRFGYTEYFDYVERYMRNYISNLQFIATPEFDDYYREKNKDIEKEELDKAIDIIRNFQGGIIGGSGLNDYENALLGGLAGYMMFGCCAPEGMRAIYTSWSNTIVKQGKSRLGPAGIYINMSFNVDRKWAKVISFMNKEGRITVIAKETGKYFIRPPHWTVREDVYAFSGNRRIDTEWSGDYVAFDAAFGDEISITYPMIAFEHKVKGLWGGAAAKPELEMRFSWLGNMVTDSVPTGGRTPLFSKDPRILPDI